MWLSILNTTACPSPISTTPAFSPGPQITCGPLVGKLRNHFFEDLYEQCSFHMAEKIPNSVKVGTRPMISRIFCYSSAARPWAEISSSEISGSRILAPNENFLHLIREAFLKSKQSAMAKTPAGWPGRAGVTLKFCVSNSQRIK